MHLTRNAEGELELHEEAPVVIEREHWVGVYVCLDHIEKVMADNRSLCLDEDEDYFTLLQKFAEDATEM